MSIRYKLLFFFLVQHFFFLFIALLLSEFLVRPHVLSLEQEKASEKIEQIKNAFENELSHLKLLSKDWAVWDDAYAFMQDKNEEFIRRNLKEDILENINLHRIEFFDTQGRSILKKERGKLDISSLLDKEGLLKKEYTSWENGYKLRGKSGVVKLKDTIVLASCYPILAGDGKSKSRGTLLMLRVVDAEMIASINKSTNANVALLGLDEASSVSLFQKQDFISEALSPQVLKISAYLLGIDAKPSIMIEIEMKREFVIQSEKLILSLFVFGGVLGSISFMISLFLLRREIVTPLNALGQHMKKIRDDESFLSSELSSREDEIGLLAKEFNGLITHIDETNKTLAKVARVDALTGLANRLDLEERFESERRQSCREKQDMSILMLDIDYFKKYNDTYGHVKGDIVLTWVAQAIKGSGLRPRDYIARYGGEEFIVILPKTHVDGSVVVAKRIIENIENLKIEHETSLLDKKIISVSIGCLTLTPNKNESQEFIINLADEALYMAKEQGRDRYCVYQRNNA